MSPIGNIKSKSCHLWRSSVIQTGYEISCTLLAEIPSSGGGWVREIGSASESSDESGAGVVDEAVDEGIHGGDSIYLF